MAMAANATYVELLRDTRWQKKRLAIMERDDWCCRWCRDSDNSLQVHHRRYVKDRPPWETPDSQLITLCAGCHERATKLINKAKDILADLNIYQLPVAVATMERLWSVGEGHPLATTIDRLEAEKAELVAQPFTSAASRKVEALDELTDTIWSYIRADFVEKHG